MGYLDDEVKFAENPDPRCACVLLLDTSGSMRGPAIEALNEGLQTFEQTIRQDSLAQKRVEIAIITFGNGGVQTLQDFTTARDFETPILAAGGNTPMGEAINRALDMIRDFKMTMNNNGVPYYRPWIFMITDGEPDDGWQTAAQRLREEEMNKGTVFFAIGVEHANMQTLAKITVPTRKPLMLKGLDFSTLFLWLSNSMTRISHSKVGDQIALPSVDGWAAV